MLTFRWVDREIKQKQEWFIEEQLCFEDSLECWSFEKSHQIIGFTFDEKDGISPEFAWFLTSTPSHKSETTSEWEKENEFCLHTEFDTYECYFDKESKIVGARYDEDREEVVYVSIFDLRNMLHLKNSHRM